jgi:hypothetical protein
MHLLNARRGGLRIGHTERSEHRRNQERTNVFPAKTHEIASLNKLSLIGNKHNVWHAPCEGSAALTFRAALSTLPTVLATESS